MKFCRSTLSAICRPLFMKNWRYIRGKEAWFWHLKPYFNSFRRIWRTYGRQVSRKTFAKSLAACDSRRLHCISPGRVKKLQKFINFCVKVGHSANLKHSNSTWRPWSSDSCEMYKISTSRNGMDLRQLSFWYRALSCGTDWFTKGVYIWVTHLHIVVPTITCSLRYA